MKFSVTFKRGPRVVARVTDTRDVSANYVSVEDLQKLPMVEQLLERLTGLRVHIEQQHEDDPPAIAEVEADGLRLVYERDDRPRRA